MSPWWRKITKEKGQEWVSGEGKHGGGGDKRECGAGQLSRIHQCAVFATKSLDSYCSTDVEVTLLSWLLAQATSPLDLYVVYDDAHQGESGSAPCMHVVNDVQFS